MRLLDMTSPPVLSSSSTLNLPMSGITKFPSAARETKLLDGSFRQHAAREVLEQCVQRQDWLCGLPQRPAVPDQLGQALQPRCRRYACRRRPPEHRRRCIWHRQVRQPEQGESSGQVWWPLLRVSPPTLPYNLAAIALLRLVLLTSSPVTIVRTAATHEPASHTPPSSLSLPITYPYADGAYDMLQAW